MASAGIARGSGVAVRARSWARGLVLAVVTVLATPALAQPTPQQVAQRAITQIRNIAAQTVDREEAAALRAVNHIRELDVQNAPDRVIIAFGKRAVESLQGIGQTGRTHINATTRSAVEALNRLNAPPELIEAVEAAARHGRSAINNAQQRAVAAVRQAVDEATGPG